MRRTAGKLAILLIICVTIVVVLIPRERNFNLADIKISTHEWNEIKASRSKNKSLSVAGLRLDGHELQEDADGKRFFYSLIEGSEQAKNPTITIPKGNTINIASKIEEVSNDKIANNGTFKLLLYTNYSYREINIVATTLPTMNIDTKGQPNISEKDSNASIYLFDNRADAKRRVIKSDTDIHLRGSTSLILEKQSFKLDLKSENKRNHISLLGMRKDNDWILNSLYGDYEKVRNILSAQMWRDCCSQHNEFGAENSFEYRYVELFIDNSYHGLYLLGYKPDERTADLGANEFSYKNRDWSNADVLDEDDNFKRYYELDSKYANEDAAEEELRGFIDLLSGNNTQAIRDNFDIKNAIDVELHAQITAETDYTKDNKTKNLYMTVKNTTTNRKILYTPWDFDLSFGNTWMDGMKNNTSTFSYGQTAVGLVQSGYTPVANLVQNGDKTIRSELEKRYARLRKGAWSNERIFALICEYEVELFASGAYYRDQERWPMGNYIEDIEDLSRFKKFVHEHSEFLDEYYHYK